MTQKKKKKDGGWGNLCTVRGTGNSVLTGIFTHGPKRRKQYKGYEPAIPLLGIYLEKNIEKIRASPIFTAVLFITGKTWKQPKCPSTEESTNNMCVHACIYVHTHTHIYIHMVDY